MRRNSSARITRTIRQDLGFITGVLLLLSVALLALTSLSIDEDEFFGLGDDLHGLLGWSMVVLTALHTILCWSQMMNYAKRRLRNRFGVGGVIRTSSDCGREQEPASPRRGFDEPGIK
jgi:hypothetical protein